MKNNITKENEPSGKGIDRKFKHKTWFTDSNLTIRQAVEYFASCTDSFELKKIRGGFLYICSMDDGISWRVDEETAEYFKERRGFWESHRNTDRKSVSEYISFWSAYTNTPYTHLCMDKACDA